MSCNTTDILWFPLGIAAIFDLILVGSAISNRGMPPRKLVDTLFRWAGCVLLVNVAVLLLLVVPLVAWELLRRLFRLIF